MDRLKWLNEEIAAKRTELKNLSDKVDSEKRARNPEEVTRWEALESEIENLQKELESRNANPVVKEERKINAVTDAKVGESKMESKEARNLEIGKLLTGHVRKDSEMIEKAKANLKEGGHYRDFSTVVDGSGGIFLPTSVSADIMELQREYGIIPRFAKSYGNILSGSTKVPSVLSKLVLYGVSEGGSIQGTTVDLGGVELKAHKWGGITNWTTEIGDQAGSVLVPLLIRQFAEALANVKDTTFLKGDGTSAFNNIKGLEALAGTANYIRNAVATGETSYAALKPDSFINATLQVAPAARKRSIFVFHPNFEATLRTLKDGDGRYVYAMPNDRSRDAAILWGYPVYYTEAATFDTGSNKVYGYFFDPSMVAYADGRALTVKELTEGTVKDASGNDVNLATTDSKALRVTAMFDVKPSNAVVLDAGVTKGGFAVLKTA